MRRWAIGFHRFGTFFPTAYSPSAGGGYGAPPSPITDSEDVVFGPGYTANQVGPYGPTGVGRDPPGESGSDQPPPIIPF